jgi:hypothetical protein
MKRTFLTMAAFASTALLAAGPAWAHAKLVSSTPAANATLRAAPGTITLRFNERLVPAFSKVELLMPAHNNMKVAVTTTVSRDGKSIAVVPQQALTRGAYKIVWSAASSDGHKMNGEVPFQVG